MRLAFNSGNAVVMVDQPAAKLWVVYTEEQYLEIDAQHGPFTCFQRHLPKREALPYESSVQYLSGNPARYLTLGVIQAYHQGQSVERFKRRLTSDIAAANWFPSTSHSCAVVYGNMLGKIFFAIVFDLPQLQQLQYDYFPDGSQHIAVFQMIAPLPATANTSAFVLEGDVAVQCIQGCYLYGLLG